MSTFFTLLKTTLNVNYGFSVFKYHMRKDKKKLLQSIGVIIAALFGLGSIALLFGGVMFGVFIGGKSLGNPEIVLTISFLMTQILVLVFGIFYIMSAFYFSNDINILMALPIKPSYVLSSKLIVVMINEYLTVFPILLPPLVIYGVGTGQGFFYYLKALLVLLASPAIPLALCSLFTVALMRFVNLRKSKDLLAVIGGFVGLAFALGWNYLMQKMPKLDQAEYFKNFAADYSGLIGKVGQSFPPSVWITYALSDSGLRGSLYLGLFLLVAVVLFAVLVLIADRWFFKSIAAGQEVTRKRRKISREEMGNSISRVSNPVISLFRKEWKIFFRTPVYVMNGIAGMLLAPIFIVMPFMTQREEMGEFFKFIHDPAYAAYVTLGVLGILLYITNINVTASTAVSREGNMYWISRMIPVSAREQISAKLLHSMAIEMIGIIISLVVISFVLKLPGTSIIVLLVLSVIGNLLFVTLNLIIDVLRPKLNWTNPQEAVKQNLNSLFGMLVTTLIAVVLAAATVGLIFLGVKGWLLYALVGVLMLVLTLPCIGWLFASAENMYQKIEA